MNPWVFAWEGFEPDGEGLREALSTLGNGYFATRGALPEASGEVSYPGTYVAGCFNRLTTQIAGRDVVNEDMVNVPNWLAFTFRVPGESWLDLRDARVLEHRLELDMQRGILSRFSRFRDAGGRTTELRQRRFVHMGRPHLAGLETTLTAEDWAGPIEILSALDGTVTNIGVPRYRELAHHHLVPVVSAVDDDGTAVLVVETSQSHVRLALAARHAQDGTPVRTRELCELDELAGYVGGRCRVELEPGVPVTIEKIVALHTSRDAAISAPEVAARASLAGGESFAELLSSHEEAWRRLWRRAAIDVPSDPETTRIARLHAFHTLQVASPNAAGLDVGVPARGLHGEAYRGHIFWDELYILPFVTRALPQVARALLLYRYRRLPAARAAARAAGKAGAMFPWQSGSDGSEETQTMHLNPNSGRWLEDNSHLQRHVAIAIAHNVWKYYEWTLDDAFMSEYGAELFLELLRFLAGLATFNEATGRYDIRGVMGPDEYHDGYPDAEQPGIDNNVYTNVMVAWMATKADEILAHLPAWRRDELCQQLGIDDAERSLWDDLSRRLTVVVDEGGVLSQFEGYAELAEFDWEGYRAKYGDIHRLDRILEAEGDTANRYKLSKQADTVMLFYLLSESEVGAVLERLGVDFSAAAARRTIEYHERRSSHGSTLSRAVYAWVMARHDPVTAGRHFRAALGSDVNDIQGGTTREGVHLGVMASTVDMLQRGALGLACDADGLHFDPSLPDEVSEVAYRMVFRGHLIVVRCTPTRLLLELAPGAAPAIRVSVAGAAHELAGGAVLDLPLPAAEALS